MREGFLKAIEENPRDQLTRNVYADWLEENDEPEEADRQRAWVGGVEWLEDFAGRCGRTCVNYLSEGYWCSITFMDVIQAGHDMVSSDGMDEFTQVGSEEARDQLNTEEKRQEFWKNWSIVTGIAVSDALEQQNPFSCSC